jgi:NhaA family Na+:H+ antiporter
MTRLLRFIADRYLVLPLGAIAALAWANTRPESYFAFAHRVSFAVNNVGMALFFGLIAKEVVDVTAPGGPLHTWRQVLLAVVAAAGGIAGSAVMYFAYLSASDESSILARGWPIACATDVAFSYLLARSLCRRAAVPLLLLMAVAGNAIGMVILEVHDPIVDGHRIGVSYIALAFWIAIAFRNCDVRSFWPYVLGGGAVSWWGLYQSGLHPALALVPIVPFLPRTARGRSLFVEAPLSQFARAAKYPAQVVLLLFTLINAGVMFHGFGPGTWAVMIAALAGKPLGVLLAVGVAIALGLRLPYGVGWRDVVFVAFASSMGLTFALFFATATFSVGPLLAQAKFGALLTACASLVTFAAARLIQVGRLAVPVKRPSLKAAESGVFASV